MTDLIALMECLTAPEQAGAIRVLDALSRPLTAREIELILRNGNATRSQADKLATVLKGWTIIAMVGPGR